MDIHVSFKERMVFIPLVYRNFASPIAEAASVLIGPALIAFTLMPFAPRSLARYLTLASKS